MQRNFKINGLQRIGQKINTNQGLTEVADSNASLLIYYLFGAFLLKLVLKITQHYLDNLS